MPLCLIALKIKHLNLGVMPWVKRLVFSYNHLYMKEGKITWQLKTKLWFFTDAKEAAAEWSLRVNSLNFMPTHAEFNPLHS
jgi:uncharacterized protein affecting Mg2+/Co2+ transport